MVARVKVFMAEHPLVLLPVVVVLAVAVWFAWLSCWMDGAHSIAVQGMPKPAPVAASAPAIGLEAAAQQRALYFAEIGQTGDSFGGLNALLTGIAGAPVFWAGFMQYLTLVETREEGKRAKLVELAEKKARQKQEFESLFFRMLDLTRDITERIETPPMNGAAFAVVPGEGMAYRKVPGRKGTAALENFAWRVAGGWQKPEDNGLTFGRLVTRFKKKVYERAPSAMGPYFRLLYQTFKLIDESRLDAEDKITYSNIARGQISEGAVQLLALNGWGLYGRKFVPLIEKFGLLEHLHPDYRRAYEGALLTGYRKRAFLGSKERAQAGNEWDSEPLLPESYLVGRDHFLREDGVTESDDSNSE